MGSKTVKQHRRANRQRKRADHQRATAPRDDVYAIVVGAIHEGARASADRDPTIVTEIARMLADLDVAVPPGSPSLPAVAASRTILGMLSDAYEGGWQPMDMLHVTRRSLKPAALRLAVAAVVYESRLAGAGERAPLDWLAQLEAAAEHDRAADEHARMLPVIHPHDPEAVTSFLTALQIAAHGSGTIDESGWTAVLALLGLWSVIPRWNPCGPRRHSGRAGASRLVIRRHSGVAAHLCRRVNRITRC